MSTLNYTQYGLAPLIEVELEDGVAPLQFNVALKGEEGWVSLRYEQPGVTDHDYIAITENSIVENQPDRRSAVLLEKLRRHHDRGAAVFLLRRLDL